jgi:NAD(P)-dependent dehydrogenase (short-subunit alcohol dehydrogenase family)
MVMTATRSAGRARGMPLRRTPGGRNSVLGALLAAIVLLVGLPVPGSAVGAEPADDDVRTVLITGANRGIGLELARQYAADGWRVIGTARKPAEADALGAVAARVVQLDVTDAASVERLTGNLAGTPVDLLINNAGIQPLMWKLAEIDFDAFERALAVNTVGPVRVTRALLPSLRAGELRRIVNITTNLSSIEGNTEGGFYGYRESKAALNMFTKSLAAELGPEGFVCIVLHPGWVKTDLGGPQAPLEVTESAQGMRAVIDRLTPADNGTFLTWAGERMAW